MRIKRNGISTEAQEQKALITWSKYKRLDSGESLNDYLIAIPNGGSRNPIEAKNLKLQGVKAGIPDLFLTLPKNSFGGLWIELKRKKGGVISELQKESIERLRKVGYCVEVAKGFDEAKIIIEKYLGG